jgi:hypothetical protein
MLAALAAWAFFSFKIAMLVARAAGSRPAKASLAVLVFAAMLVAPMADDLLGQAQYQRYCEAGDKVDVRGTIKVAPEVGLFTAAGDWKIAGLAPADHAERRRLGEVAESFVRWDHGVKAPTDSVFPIQARKTRLFDKSSGAVVAEWTSYHYAGGFLRRGFLDSASQCFPQGSQGDVYRPIFVLQRT